MIHVYCQLPIVDFSNRISRASTRSLANSLTAQRETKGTNASTGNWQSKIGNA
jgi:hypothetical protein